jgi:hypothetical protein
MQSQRVSRPVGDELWVGPCTLGRFKDAERPKVHETTQTSAGAVGRRGAPAERRAGAAGYAGRNRVEAGEVPATASTASTTAAAEYAVRSSAGKCTWSGTWRPVQ